MQPRRPARRPWLLLFFATWACGGEKTSAPGPRLVVLFAACTVNASYLAPYEPGIPFTPNFAEFAEQSRVFTKHHTEAGISGIAFASIFSGTQAFDHGVFWHPRQLSDSVQLIGEYYARAGYDVHSWLNHKMANAQLNYAQGVDRDQRSDEKLAAGDRDFQSILDRLEGDPDYRAFVVTNFQTSHRPYVAPKLAEFCRAYPDQCAGYTRDRERSERLRALFKEHHVAMSYDFDRTVQRLGLSADDVEYLKSLIEVLYRAGIFELDQRFGDLVHEIERRGLLDNSLIVFTADHGESLCRDGTLIKFDHGFDLLPEVLRVPLLVHAPFAGVVPGRYESVTRSIDVLPTMLALSGISLQDYHGPGWDLSGAMLGREPPPLLSAFSHTQMLGDTLLKRYEEQDLRHILKYYPRNDPELMWVSVRRGDLAYKLCRLEPPNAPNGFVPFVFDWTNDPTESVNLLDPADAEQNAVFEQLESYRRGLVEACKAWEENPDGLAEHESVDLLRQLGYVK